MQVGVDRKWEESINYTKSRKEQEEGGERTGEDEIEKRWMGMRVRDDGPHCRKCL